jgi:hypothetical protein
MVRSIAGFLLGKSAILVTVKTEKISQLPDLHSPGENFQGSGWQRKQPEDGVQYDSHTVRFRGPFFVR